MLLFCLGFGPAYRLAVEKSPRKGIQYSNMLQIHLPADPEFAVTTRHELRAQRPKARKHLGWP